MTKPKSEQGHSESPTEQFQATLKRAGVKITPQRLEIFRELAKDDKHPDVEMIFRAVQQRMPTVSLDTVYRTLWMLRDLGLIKRLGPDRDVVRFDANLEQHHHFVCVRCGLIRDFQSTALDNLPVQAPIKDFGTVLEAQVEVRGICVRCQAKKKDDRPEDKPRKKSSKQGDKEET